MSDYASVPEPGAVRLERILPGPMERVWAYITDPELRGTWFAGGPLELRVGGAVDLHYDHTLVSDEPIPEPFLSTAVGQRQAGRVTRCEPPRLLAITWGEGRAMGEVTFELSPSGGDTRLVLTHRRLPGEAETIDAAGGWHAHLDVLQDRLDGGPVRPFWAAHQLLEEEYRRLVPELLRVR